jgi:Flp pilus assembly protein TadD
MPKPTRFVPSLIALFLGCSVLGGTAQAGWFDWGSKPSTPAPQKDDKPATTQLPATNLDDSIRQAQMLRLAGNYDEAINHLSQLMLVAADDSRVISEYGKTLVSMGRAEEAEKFLTRAQQLEPQDWTIYSALGVAYDQIGNPKDAQINYEHALALRPGEPSVLSNYALSRMQAKDPDMARKLAERAEIANAAAKDDKITRNIALVRTLAPESADKVALNAPVAPPLAAPHVAVSQASLAAVQYPQPIASNRPAPVPAAAIAAPQPLGSNSLIQAQPQEAQFLNQAPRGVVMQPVPVDPLAGPVEPKVATSHAPRSLQPKVGNDMAVKTLVKTDASKPVPSPAKPLTSAESLEARAEAIAKTLNKPSAIAQATKEANKGLPQKPTAPSAQVSLAVKAADVKPNALEPAPKVLAPKPVKTADTTKAQTSKTATKPKDAIPGLRLSANAY